MFMLFGQTRMDSISANVLHAKGTSSRIEQKGQRNLRGEAMSNGFSGNKTLQGSNLI